MFRRITRRDSRRTLILRAAQSETRLKRALSLATSRARRSHHRIRRLLASADVRGRVKGQSIKAAIVSFTAEPFRGGLHQVYPWQLLDDLSDAELATRLSTGLRTEVERKLRVMRDRS